MRSTISPCSLSTMTSKLSNLWPSMVPTQRKKVVRSSTLNSAVYVPEPRVAARLSENRRADFTPLDRPYQDRAVEYDVFGKQLAHLAAVGLPDSRSLRKGCIVKPPMPCYLLKSRKGSSSRPNRIYAVFVQRVLRCRLVG